MSMVVNESGLPFHLHPLNQMIRGQGNRRRNAEDTRQRELQEMYRRILGEMAVGRFKWTGLENTRIDRRYLEMRLYLSALAVVTRNDSKLKVPGRPNRVGSGHLVALAATPSGYKNVVDNPMSFTTYGPYFQGAFIQARDCVPVWGNAFRVPDTTIVDLYAYKLARLDRTIEINSDHTRHTKFLLLSENKQLSGANIQDSIERGESVINVDAGTMEEIGQQVIDLGVDPKSIEVLSILRGRIWSECMGLLGVNNANQDKKERLVESEVNANDDQVDAIRRANLNTRQYACDLMREKYKSEVPDVWVEYHSGPSMQMPTLDETLGGYQ